MCVLLIVINIFFKFQLSDNIQFESWNVSTAFRLFVFFMKNYQLVSAGLRHIENQREVHNTYTCCDRAMR